MAVHWILSVRTFSSILCILHLFIKGVPCSECSDLARILETPVVTPCQPTASHVTGSGVVFDFYESNTAESCSCSIRIPSTTNVSLSMSEYQGLGISIDSGCGSRIEVHYSQSGLLTMECRVFGSIALKPGENASVKLYREQNGDARYCMLLSTDPSFIMDVTCEAVGPPPITTTTTKPTTTTELMTTESPTTTTTKITTSSTTVLTTPAVSSQPSTITSHPTTTTTTKQPTTTATKPASTTPKQTTTTKHITTTLKPPATTTTQTTTVTKPNTTSAKPTETTSAILTTGQSVSPTSSSSSLSTGISTTTTRAIGGGTNVRGQKDDTNNNLTIILPVVVGVFLLILLLVVITQLVRTKKKQKQEPDMEKFKFGYTFPKRSVFLHTSGMVETTKYDSNEDLHGYSDQYNSVTNPVYIQDEPDLSDQHITHFTSAESNSSESPRTNTEINTDVPLYSVVNKTNTELSLDFSKMSDLTSSRSSETDSIGVLEENERNLRHEETFQY